jgi:hypothetical protein
MRSQSSVLRSNMPQQQLEAVTQIGLFFHGVYDPPDRPVPGGGTRLLATLMDALSAFVAFSSMLQHCSWSLVTPPSHTLLSIHSSADHLHCCFISRSRNGQLCMCKMCFVAAVRFSDGHCCLLCLCRSAASWLLPHPLLRLCCFLNSPGAFA